MWELVFSRIYQSLGLTWSLLTQNARVTVLCIVTLCLVLHVFFDRWIFVSSLLSHNWHAVDLMIASSGTLEKVSTSWFLWTLLKHFISACSRKISGSCTLLVLNEDISSCMQWCVITSNLLRIAHQLLAWCSSAHVIDTYYIPNTYLIHTNYTNYVCTNGMLEYIQIHTNYIPSMEMHHDVIGM
jgi:hypothetical protein